MKAGIGILSYLPPDEPRRGVRKARALRTLAKCSELFPDVPKIVIAQGWKAADAVPGAVFSMHPRLGILGARRELRETFLRHTDWDCLIMLDDDAELSGSREDADSYMAELQSHPGCFGERNGTSLKMFSICRGLLEEADFPDIDPEKGQGYEDRAFVGMLRERFPNMRFSYRSGPEANDNATSDPFSTWERPFRGSLRDCDG